MFSDLDKLFIQYEALDASLKPLLNEQLKLKEAIKKALVKTKLDNYSSGKVTATKIVSERVMYPKGELEAHFTAKQLKPVKKVISIESTRIAVAKERNGNTKVS